MLFRVSESSDRCSSGRLLMPVFSGQVAAEVFPENCISQLKALESRGLNLMPPPLFLIILSSAFLVEEDLGLSVLPEFFPDRTSFPSVSFSIMAISPPFIVSSQMNRDFQCVFVQDPHHFRLDVYLHLVTICGCFFLSCIEHYGCYVTYFCQF